MERILALLVDEQEYAGELSAYLSSKSDFIFKPVIFTGSDLFLDYEENHNVDLLLCSEGFMPELKGRARTQNICILTEHSLVGEQTESNIIFKYQSSEEILREIMEFYSSYKSAAPENETIADKRFICVCSPLGGSYCSTYSLALADYYSKKGHTLFISFDPFFLLPGESKKYTDKNLSDIIYFLQIYEKNPMEFIGRVANRRGNLEYVSGVSHWFDIADITPLQMRKLFTALCESDVYESIVVDMGGLGSAGIELLAGCSSIYVPIRRTSGYKRILEEWKRQLSFSGQREILQKVVERELPFDETLSGDYEFECLLDGLMGRYIKETEENANSKFRAV